MIAYCSSKNIQITPHKKAIGTGLCKNKEKSRKKKSTKAALSFPCHPAYLGTTRNNPTSHSH